MKYENKFSKKTALIYKRKILLRNKIKNIYLPLIQKQYFDELISKALLENPRIISATSIGIYLAFIGEPNLNTVITNLIKQKKILYAPCIQTNELVFRKFISYDDMTKNKYSFLEPASINPAIEPKKLEILLVPGIAFDKSMNRLGRGKGYYDRYLEKYSGISIGICYSFQIKKSIPHEIHDQKVSMIITEKT